MKTKIFKMQVIRSEYTVKGHEAATPDTIWLSQKCWFNSGTTVLITDEQGNIKIFTKE